MDLAWSRTCRTCLVVGRRTSRIRPATWTLATTTQIDSAQILIDWAALAAVVPPLRGSPISRLGEIDVRVEGAHPQPTISSYIEHGTWLLSGFGEIGMLGPAT
jgi:hypothetical protein